MSALTISYMLMITYFIVLRMIPLIISEFKIGVDQWYWKYYVETVKKEKKFPPVLKQYKLDIAQWYPPLFPLILLLFSNKILGKYSFLVALLFDLIRFAVTIFIFNYFFEITPLKLTFIGVVYSTIPIIVNSNTQLNPRVLGSIFLDVSIVMIIQNYSEINIYWIVAVVLAGLCLLTHKMTSQLLFVLIIGMALLMKNIELLLLLPSILIVAFILSGGFYYKVLLAHVDIVLFWSKNWKYLQANPIKESPIYGETATQSHSSYHQKGIKGVIRHLAFFIGFNPASVLAGIACIFYIDSFNSIMWVICIWNYIVIIWALGTLFIPVLKGVGSGYLYQYNAALPSVLLLGILLTYASSGIAVAMVAIILIVNQVSLVRYFINIKKREKIKKNGFEDAINYLQSGKKGTVMCVPPQMYDEVAYRTKQDVLFGGHGYGFQKLLQPTFPRLLIKFDIIKEQYNIRYILAQNGYLSDKFINDIAYSLKIEFKEITLYVL